MPGTIRVSVLEFMDLPNLSPSPISIKVSMGRRHYEARDKGDFSFPLTTLRDDVVVVIQDAEGNEISRAGVQAKSIVEKGFWDDLFPLQGGGHVHLQFQFALSEDDRNRIRTMRETVLKRKHVELQERSNLAPSFYLNPELSDSQNCLLQVGDLSSKEAARQRPSPSTKIFSANEKQLSDENDTDKKEDNSSVIPMLQAVDMNQPNPDNTAMVERIETESQDVEGPSRAVRSEENLFYSGGPEFTNAPSKSAEKTLNSAEASPLDVEEPSRANRSDKNLFHSQGSEFINAPSKSEEKTSKSAEASPHDVGEPSRPVRSDKNLSHSQGSEITSAPSKSEEKTFKSAEASPLDVGKPSRAVRSDENLFHSQGSEFTNAPSKSEEKTLNSSETSPHDVEEPSRAVRSDVNLFHSRGSEFTNAPSKSEEKILNSAEASPHGKSPSNVKKVISAFESSLTQDTRPRIKPTLRKTRSIEKEASLKEKQPKKETKQITRHTASEMKHDLANVKREEETKSNTTSEDPQKSVQLEGNFSQKGNEKDKIDKEYTKMDAKNDDESYVKLRTTKWETDKISERMLDDHPITRQLSKSVPEKPDYRRNTGMEESRTQQPSRNSQEMNTQGTLANKVKSSSSNKDEPFPSKSYGGWIFPDEGRRHCVTAAGNQMLDLGSGRTSNTFIHKGEMKISMEESRDTSETKANEGQPDHQKLIKPESSEEARGFEGPLANALKIAIMIGFGTLVLLTRQRKKKK